MCCRSAVPSASLFVCLSIGLHLIPVLRRRSIGSFMLSVHPVALPLVGLVCSSGCRSVRPSVYLSVRQSACTYDSLATRPFMCLDVRLCVRLSWHMHSRSSARSSVRQSYPDGAPSVHPSVNQIVNSSVNPSSGHVCRQRRPARRVTLRRVLLIPADRFR